MIRTAAMSTKPLRARLHTTEREWRSSALEGVYARRRPRRLRQIQDALRLHRSNLLEFDYKSSVRHMRLLLASCESCKQL